MKKSDLEKVLAAARQQLVAAGLAGSVADADGVVASVALGEAPDAPRPLLRLRDAEPCIDALLEHMRRGAGVLAAETAGAVRRRCSVIGEVSLLVSAQRPARPMRHFLAYLRGSDARQLDASRGTLLLDCGLPVDLRIVPPRCFGAMLHTLTGSAAHNEALRHLGLSTGVRVSDYGLFRLLTGRAGARRLGGQQEHDVFAALGLPWIPPELRENSGEIEAAMAGTLPRLIEADDLRPDIDHLPRTEFRADAEGGFDPTGSEGLLVVSASDIASLLRALPQRIAHVVSGWPREGEVPDSCDVARVIDELAATGTALEVRASGDGPDERVIRFGRDRGVRFLLHAARDDVRYALDRARRGWLGRQHVINTLEPAALQAWLASRPAD